MSYATTGDVAVQLGRPATSNAETDQWEAWLAIVERAISRAFTRAGFDLDAQVGLSEPSAAEVADVEVAAVIRKIQNPTWGETSYTKSLDDGSVTRRREGGADGDPLSLLDWELSTLIPVKSSGAFSTRPGFMPDCGGFRSRGW